MPLNVTVSRVKPLIIDIFVWKKMVVASIKVHIITEKFSKIANITSAYYRPTNKMFRVSERANEKKNTSRISSLFFDKWKLDS